ncbi:MAG: AAA family ATPase [Acidobacteriota bacterium]
MSDRPKIVLAVGLPGSGKSAYFQGLGVHPVSSDALRLQLADDETDQTVNGRVFALLRHILQQRLELCRPVTYVDATNLTRRDRQPYVRMARQNDCEIEALWFDVPLEVCKARNAGRGRVVPAHIMDQMAAKFVPPSVVEGFERVTIAPG